MDIKHFAVSRRLKTSVDKDGITIIVGKHGQIYEISDTTLGTMFMPREYRPRKFTSFKRAADAAGMTARQVGDSEGCFEFNPADSTQARLAIQIAGVRAKRTMSPERAASLAARLAVARASRSATSIYLN
jgi:hypothetical protein